ncbi:MAG: histidine phosphatase family protein [Solirubrobacteraceae bacterium]
MNTSMKLWLVRHAEKEWSVALRHTGLTDVPLTEAGREHARRLRPVLAAEDFALVLSSPLSRARDTAEIAGFGARCELRDELVEWKYGAYEGMTTAEIRESRPGWTVGQGGALDGEAPDEIGARVDRVIAETRAVDWYVVCFAHGHVLRVLGARWVDQPASFGARLALATGAVCVLGFERDTPVVWRWNDVPTA